MRALRVIIGVTRRLSFAGPPPAPPGVTAADRRELAAATRRISARRAALDAIVAQYREGDDHLRIIRPRR